jgi:superfamily II DNA/RNA helicase
MTPDPAEDTTTFADLGLRPELLRALSGPGYEEPTPIQREAVPPLLQGRDLLGQAATGTGKTAAFALPVLERIARHAGRGEPMALVLVPTRELAMQVSEVNYDVPCAPDAYVHTASAGSAGPTSRARQPDRVGTPGRPALLGPPGCRRGR